jgi:hypothetical protein
LEYGIYEYPDMPSSVTLKVDGNNVPISDVSAENLNIVPFLNKDIDGKVTRGAWHTIEITPNGLGRIVAQVVKQVFIQSRGGGSF